MVEKGGGVNFPHNSVQDRSGYLTKMSSGEG